MVDIETTICSWEGCICGTGDGICPVRRILVSVTVAQWKCSGRIFFFSSSLSSFLSNQQTANLEIGPLGNGSGSVVSILRKPYCRRSRSPPPSVHRSVKTLEGKMVANFWTKRDPNEILSYRDSTSSDSPFYQMSFFARTHRLSSLTNRIFG